MEVILKKEYGQLEDYVYDSVGSFVGKIVAPMLKEGKVELEADELPSVTRDKIFKRCLPLKRIRDSLVFCYLPYWK